MGALKHEHEMSSFRKCSLETVLKKNQSRQAESHNNSLTEAVRTRAGEAVRARARDAW